MNFQKPKFWDYKKPNIYSYFLLPISIVIQIIYFLKTKLNRQKKFNIRTVCVGNIYIGGTGKTSLSLKLNEILIKKKIRSCFIKKYYSKQLDEQKLLSNNGKLFTAKKRSRALSEAENENYQVAIFDDGLQDNEIDYDLRFVCFNSKNFIGNGRLIPSGPLREKIQSLKKYDGVFLKDLNDKHKYILGKIKAINAKIKFFYTEYKILNLNKIDRKKKIFS